MVELNILHVSCHIFSSPNRNGIVDGHSVFSFIIQIKRFKSSMKILELCPLWGKILFLLFVLRESERGHNLNQSWVVLIPLLSQVGRNIQVMLRTHIYMLFSSHYRKVNNCDLLIHLNLVAFSQQLSENFLVFLTWITESWSWMLTLRRTQMKPDQLGLSLKSQTRREYVHEINPLALQSLALILSFSQNLTGPVLFHTCMAFNCLSR